MKASEIDSITEIAFGKCAWLFGVNFQELIVKMK
jgi:hypothetical protein